MNYTKRLFDLRVDNELKQQDIANILNTTKQSYGMYENGQRRLKIDDAIKLAKFFDVSTDYLLGLTNNPKKFW